VCVRVLSPCVFCFVVLCCVAGGVESVVESGDGVREGHSEVRLTIGWTGVCVLAGTGSATDR